MDAATSVELTTDPGGACCNADAHTAHPQMHVTGWSDFGDGSIGGSTLAVSIACGSPVGCGVSTARWRCRRKLGRASGTLFVRRLRAMACRGAWEIASHNLYNAMGHQGWMTARQPRSSKKARLIMA